MRLCKLGALLPTTLRALQTYKAPSSKGRHPNPLAQQYGTTCSNSNNTFQFWGGFQVSFVSPGDVILMPQILVLKAK